MERYVASGAKGSLPRSRVSPFDWAVYSANLGRIGLAGWVVIADVIGFYSQLRTLTDEEAELRSDRASPRRLAHHAECWEALSRRAAYIAEYLNMDWWERLTLQNLCLGSKYADPETGIMPWNRLGSYDVDEVE